MSGGRAMDKKICLSDAAASLGVPLSDHQLDQFLKYYEMLVETNKVMNLTAITEFEDVVQKHFIDSLSLLRALQPEKIKNMVDIGTGAGFPGIPLKIAYPHINTLLVDSVGKRVNFLRDVIETLDLQGITAIHSRAEDLGRDAKYREKYDLCTSRAVARLASLSEYCLPFVEKGGYFVSYKAGDCDIEVEESKKALRLLGGRLKSVEKFQLGDMQRALVVIEKTAITSRLYPRKAGTPTKSPLV